MDLNERQVRERAYFIWENEGRVFGRAEAHWLQAEAELRGRAAAPLRIEALAVETIRVASPAEVLKPRAGRTRAPAKVALAEMTAPVGPASKTTAKKASKAAATPKAAATKAVTSKAKPRAARAEAGLGASLH